MRVLQPWGRRWCRGRASSGVRERRGLWLLTIAGASCTRSLFRGPGHEQGEVARRVNRSWDRCRVTMSGTGTPLGATADLETAAVDLYWLPRGAGGHFVRLNGRVFEAAAARAARRPACDLYHSALEVRVATARFVIEQAPVRDDRGERRGVVAEGPVGIRWAGRFRILRYEIRRWRDGRIPDVDEAVDSPRRLTDERSRAQRVLDLVPQVPTPVWGRDDLKTGDMWNSNSVIAWLIARGGIDTESIHPPTAGRAPGWHAGLVVARRQQADICRRLSSDHAGRLRRGDAM
jgi:hypothetical protein